MTTIPAAPKLIEGWWRHSYGQGQRSHALRTIPGVDIQVITLCGQVWMRDNLLYAKTPTIREELACARCLSALNKWRAK